MRPEEISDAMGLLDDEVVMEADRFRKKRRNKKLSWMRWMAAAACICLVLAAVMGRNKPVTVEAGVIAEPEYPEMTQYPENWDDSKQYDAWEKDWKAQRMQIKGYENCLDYFVEKTMPQFLSEAGDENLVYSPVNVYMALSMLAEVTDGNSRQQIIDILGVENVDVLRDQVSAVWNACYRNDGTVTSVLANSLWLNQDIRFKKAVMETLADKYYAASYWGEMGSTDFNARLREWLNTQTGGLLENQIENIGMKPETVLALVSTIYYQARWQCEFWEETTEDVFHGADGDLNCDFMHQSLSRKYYWGEQFSAVAQDLQFSGSMWLILPDEGITVAELAKDGELLELISGEQWENCKDIMVNLSMPKFDVSSSMDLGDDLQAMGITEVFDDTLSDFSPLTSDLENIYVSEAVHTARVMVDEEGCTATAFTVLEAAAGEAPGETDEIDFILDRPFLFVITNESGLPLFAGVVNQPVE